MIANKKNTRPIQDKKQRAIENPTIVNSQQSSSLEEIKTASKQSVSLQSNFLLKDLFASASPQDSDYSGADMDSHSEFKQVMQEWLALDARFDQMSKLEKIEANIRRKQILDLLLYSEYGGQYSDEFMSLPKNEVKTSFQQWKSGIDLRHP